MRPSALILKRVTQRQPTLALAWGRRGSVDWWEKSNQASRVADASLLERGEQRGSMGPSECPAD